MSIKKNQRYLILQKVGSVANVLTQNKPKPPVLYKRSELSGEQALAFIRGLESADDYEIYPLSSQKLTLQTTVVCAAVVEPADPVELNPEDLDLETTDGEG